MNFIVYGSRDVNLVNKKAILFLSKKIKFQDIIVFISAQAPVKNFKMMNNNLQMCKNFCEAGLEKKISKIIYISSDAVYSDSYKKLNENSKTLPNSYHGAMHLTRELIFKMYFKNICILRPTLVYGPEDTHKGYGPNKFLYLAKKNQDISLFGLGEELRDHIYIEDLIKILYDCVMSNKNGIYNIASGKVNSFKKIAKTIVYLTKSKSKIFNTKRIGEMPHNGFRPFDIKLLKKDFKNIKFNNIESGIKKYLKS